MKRLFLFVYRIDASYSEFHAFPDHDYLFIITSAFLDRVYPASELSNI